MFSILPEKEEAGVCEKAFERSRSRAKEKGYPMVDSPCGAVEEGGMDGHKTWKG